MKAKITTWRLLWNRLPSSDNLSKRIPLNDTETNCRRCGQHYETFVHSFLRCEETMRLWNSLITWIGVSWATPQTIVDHFSSFAGLINRKGWKRKLGGLWICKIWILWRWRNDLLFGDKAWDSRRVLEEIKCRFWSWCTFWGEVGMNLSYYTWANNKLVFLE